MNIENALSNFLVIFNSSERKFRCLAFCYALSVEILNCINMQGISIFTIRKRTFREDSITIALLYKQSAISPATYLNELSQEISNVNVDIILGDFNVDAFDPKIAIIEDKLHMYDMVINKPTHLVDHCWIKWISWKVFPWSLTLCQLFTMYTVQIMILNTCTLKKHAIDIGLIQKVCTVKNCQFLLPPCRLLYALEVQSPPSVCTF